MDENQKEIDILQETFTELDEKGERKLNKKGCHLAAILGLCLTMYLLSYPFKKE